MRQGGQDKIQETTIKMNTGGPGDPNFLFEHQQHSPAMVVYQISMPELSTVGVCELSFSC